VKKVRTINGQNLKTNENDIVKIEISEEDSIDIFHQNKKKRNAKKKKRSGGKKEMNF